MTTFFDFEQDFIESLRCIPMIVRYKLDTCGVKLKLEHWNHFNQAERESLVELPCQTVEEIDTYRQYLQGLVHQQTGEYAKELTIEPHPPWFNKEEIPIHVQEKAQECNVQLTLSQWQNLEDIQRFVLIKLSRPSHENRNFVPACREFELIA